MRSGLPRVAATTAPATLPPSLPGLDPPGRGWSPCRVVRRSSREARIATIAPGTSSTRRLPSTRSARVPWAPCSASTATRPGRTVALGRAAHARRRPRRWPVWRVVAVDQLDMGFSERTGTQRGLAQRVADLGALTDELGLTGPWSRSVTTGAGVVSLGWAVDHPDLVVGVATCNHRGAPARRRTDPRAAAARARAGDARPGDRPDARVPRDHPGDRAPEARPRRRRRLPCAVPRCPGAGASAVSSRTSPWTPITRRRRSSNGSPRGSLRSTSPRS